MHFYDFAGYSQMMQDKKRMEAFSKALRKFITPESIVVEIGCGNGVFTYLACKLGAKKVYAIEPNPMISVAREAIAANGFSDRVEFIEKMSTEIELPEKADILISDLHGNLPFFENAIPAIIDARKRFLKPDAIMMPRREKIFMAAAECDAGYKKHISDHLHEFEGFKIPSAKRLLVNRTINIHNHKQKLLSDSKLFAELDFRAIESPNAENKLCFPILQAGIAHGIRAWFISEQGAGFFTDNSIENPKATYGAPLFPFEEPVEVDTGDQIEFTLRAIHEKGEYSFSWNTQIFTPEGELKAAFIQSTLANNLISTSKALTQAEFYVPKLNEKAEIERFILSAFDGEAMNGDIADALLEKFPNRFADFDEALARVGEVALRFHEA